ncbi:pantoate--beta-alanine ligase, partial [Streptomyces viridosporus]|uniref:pantoate--beta-alanine ligase n=1 Tax=Streptomyces viridosporus TaxID=67581 RepID=UPI00142ED720
LVLDYLALVEKKRKKKKRKKKKKENVLAVAARVGGTRLIDNIPLTFGTLGAAA